MLDKIYQIKYNQGNYAYYKSENENREDINKNTKFYRSYVDCKEQNENSLDLYEQTRIYNSLKKFYEQIKWIFIINT